MVFTYLRKHPELVPLFVVVGAGCVGAGYYLMRLALKNPDATWDRKNNPYPWQKIKHDQCLKVSNQCMALVNDNCLVPTIDEPGLGYMPKSSSDHYVSDVFYKTSDLYRNEVTLWLAQCL